MSMVPVYIPTRKITIMTPKPLQGLAFVLNYKGLITSRMRISDQTASVQFAAWEPFRKILGRWQLAKTEADGNVWKWLQEHATVQLVLDNIDSSENATRKNYPYLPKLVFPLNQAGKFADLFKLSTF